MPSGEPLSAIIAGRYFQRGIFEQMEGKVCTPRLLHPRYLPCPVTGKTRNWLERNTAFRVGKNQHLRVFIPVQPIGMARWWILLRIPVVRQTHKSEIDRVGREIALGIVSDLLRNKKREIVDPAKRPVFIEHACFIEDNARRTKTNCVVLNVVN